MRREQMEHILRAAASITNETEFVVVGSQALLASVPDLPPPLNQSMEPDLYPLKNPAAAILIDGSIGELSPFDEVFGYYGHGVAPDTAILPRNRRERAIIIENKNAGGARGICISPPDLAISKIAAGRENDFLFGPEMLRHAIIRPESLRALFRELPDHVRDLVAERLNRINSAAS